MLFSHIDIQEQQEIIDFIKEHFSSLYVEDCYLHYYDDEDMSSDYFYELVSRIGASTYDNGATKLIFFFNELKNWVVKVPLLGIIYEDEESEGYVKEYCSANIHTDHSINEDDYCAAEQYYCQEAKYYEIEHLFAATEYVTSVNGINIYISEKIPYDFYDYCGAYKKLDKASHSYKMAEKMYSNVLDSGIFLDVLVYFVEQYSEKVAQLLCDFLEDYNITDLHSGNIGFDKDGLIKILDCAGYYD